MSPFNDYMHPHYIEATLYTNKSLKKVLDTFQKEMKRKLAFVIFKKFRLYTHPVYQTSLHTRDFKELKYYTLKKTGKKIAELIINYNSVLK